MIINERDRERREREKVKFWQFQLLPKPVSKFCTDVHYKM
jgi:hypothetical protein